jgi:hypothetical protein
MGSVFQSIGDVKTAEFIARALGGRKSGSRWMARCPAHEDRSPSLSIIERNGRVLVHCHSGCAQADVIAALRARGLWLEAETKLVLTPEQKHDWARRRHQTEVHLANAELWKRTAVLMTEQVLANLKAALFDPTAGPAEPDTVRWYESYLIFLRRLSGEHLVDEYLRWHRDHRALSEAMVKAAWRREYIEEQVLWRVLMGETQ